MSQNPMLSAVLSAYGALPHHPGKGTIIQPFLPPLGAAHEKRIRARFGVRFECDLDDKLSRQIYYSGFDPAGVRALRRITRPGDVVLDVGANIGYYSLLFAKSGAAVHAFEPFPETNRKLRANLNLNPELNVTVWPIALSDRDGTISMAAPDPSNCGCNYVVDSDAGEIRMTTLDGFIGPKGFARIDIIKADVEGSEIGLLRGAEETIKRFRPKIIIEVNPGTLARFGKTASDLVEILGRYRYRMEVATTFGFKPLDRLPAGSEEPNVYCFPID